MAISVGAIASTEFGSVDLTIVAIYLIGIMVVGLFVQRHVCGRQSMYAEAGA